MSDCRSNKFQRGKLGVNELVALLVEHARRRNGDRAYDNLRIPG